MSRRRNCRDPAVAESFFNLLKRERIRRKICLNRMTHGRMRSNISRCSTTRSASTSGTAYCHPSSSNGRGKSEPSASTKLGAIHLPLVRDQPDDRQGLGAMEKRGGCDLKFGLELADAQAGIARTRARSILRRVGSPSASRRAATSTIVMAGECRGSDWEPIVFLELAN
jgi:hypothetical protein